MRPYALVVALVFCLAFPSAAFAQKLVYVVRHAERADGGAGAQPMTGAPADPSLSKEGEARAAKLATVLADAKIAAIYATEYKRTQETGKPLATRTGVTISTVPANQTAALAADLKSKHANDIVLVVAHSNTIPGIIKALGGPDVRVGDDEYDGLFVLVPGSGTLSKIRF